MTLEAPWVAWHVSCLYLWSVHVFVSTVDVTLDAAAACSNKVVGNVGTQTTCLVYTQMKKAGAARLWRWGAWVTGVPVPIHFLGNFQAKKYWTAMWKCARPLSCWNKMSLGPSYSKTSMYKYTATGSSYLTKKERPSHFLFGCSTEEIELGTAPCMYPRSLQVDCCSPRLCWLTVWSGFVTKLNSDFFKVLLHILKEPNGTMYKNCFVLDYNMLQ